MKFNGTDPNNSNLNAGDNILEYKVIRKIFLEEAEAFFYELEHLPTGARHIHISNKDNDNTFSVALKTVPSDSTGVAHILEHTTLCGSDKFPVRDPFFSMLKRSLNTFMNAFTSSDWTMYPFSTQNEKDYKNLMDVYLDAVFFPKLDELSFKQEGHRLEFEKTDEKEHLVYKGVVYNEMKGAMSSASQIMGRAMLNALYPTTTYGWNSGGDPAIIPRLTHEQMVSFHKRHYHPSNAFFYTYGNLPLKKTLAFIEKKVLNNFSEIDPETSVPNEKRWKESRVARYYYPLNREDDSNKKCQISMGWLTADIKDSFEVLALTLLNHILIGNAASPLRKALIDSKIGSALCDATGFDSDNKDTMFAIGLKDVNEDDAEKIEKIILDTFGSLVENGIDSELIAAAIHQIEFRQREVTNTPYPYGIKCLLRITGNWFHGGDAATALQHNSDFERLHSEIAKGHFFENRIKKYFLENNHRVVLILAPDKDLEENRNRKTEEELKQIKNTLNKDEFEKIRLDTTALEKLQDTEEDLSCLPTLEISDISPDVNIVLENKEYGEIPAKCYRQPTSGVLYFSSAAGIGNLSEELLPLVPFFCLAFTKSGTNKRDYTSLARKISANTGGIGLSVHSRTGFDGTGKCRPFMSFSGKCLGRNQSEMFDILHECASEYNFSDIERIKSLLLEFKSGLESSIVQNGHLFVISNSIQNFSSTCRLSEIWNGISQVRYIKELGEKVNGKNGESVLEKLQDDFYKISQAVFSEKNFKYALVGDDQMILSATEGLSSISNILGSDINAKLPSFDTLKPEKGHIVRNGWIANSAVSFVGASVPVVKIDHDDAPGLAVVSKLLRSNYLHREIREKGGAYGGFAVYNSEDGTFSFSSYRDPHICNTLDVFDNVGEFIKSGSFSEEEVKESILQIASGIDKPDAPGTAAKKAFYRSILKLSDEQRIDYKKRLLKVGYKDILELSEKYFGKNKPEMSVSVISGEDKIDQANQKLSDNPLKIVRI